MIVDNGLIPTTSCWSPVELGLAGSRKPARPSKDLCWGPSSYMCILAYLWCHPGSWSMLPVDVYCGARLCAWEHTGAPTEIHQRQNIQRLSPISCTAAGSRQFQ